MTAVTLADACVRLPELIALAATGEQIVIMQNGVVLAGLTPPPFQIPPPEEEAARRQAAIEAFHAATEDMRRWCAEDGIPFPPDEERGETFKSESPAA